MSKQNIAQHLAALGPLIDPVRLVVFASDAGCAGCPEVVALGRTIRAQSPKIALEIYDIAMDRDKTERYGVKRAPSIVVEDGGGRAVTFSGRVDDVFLEVLLATITALSRGTVWFPENIRTTLKLLEREVHIQVFIENVCEQCRPVAETAIGLALESPLIYTDIIVADDFPDLKVKYRITGLPKTVFGANLHMDGHVSESQFLEMIFQAEGLRTGASKRCLICGNASADMICTSCKTKIQAEAIDHKHRDEKLRKADSL
jgi:alkyl hydroperoxide reductase subunit AhpF